MSTVNVVEENSWSIPLPINKTVSLEYIDSDELFWIGIFAASSLYLLYTFLKSKT